MRAIGFGILAFVITVTYLFKSTKATGDKDEDDAAINITLVAAFLIALAVTLITWGS